MNMNTLLLEYGSSSDEEDVAPAASSQLPVAASTAPASPVEASVGKPAVERHESSVKPRHVTAESSEQVAPAETTGLDVSMDDGDEEAMLLRAGIPPAAASLPEDNETQQRIERFLRVQHDRGQDFQTTLQDKKEVRNPYILEKVVEYFGIDELQSNFSTDVFDPHGLPLHEYADALALEQKKRADARAHRQLQQQRGSDPRQLQYVDASASSNGAQ